MTPEQRINYALVKINTASVRSGGDVQDHLRDAGEALHAVLRDIEILRASVAIARAEIVDVAKRVAG